MEEEMHAKDDILDVWFVEGERPKRKDLDLRVMMDQRMELTRSAEEGWIELKDEKKYEVLFSPMPKELCVLFHRRWGECCYKWLIILLKGNLYWKKNYCYENTIKKDKLLKTCVEATKHIIFDRYEPRVQLWSCKWICRHRAWKELIGLLVINVFH